MILGIAAGGGWLWSLPPEIDDVPAPEIPPGERDALLAALRPAERRRPLIAAVGINTFTEMTDYLVPTGVLRRADVADVQLLATEPGTVALYPAALGVQPDATIAEFDRQHPTGADYVIVPAMSRDDDPAVMAWLRSQVEKRAMIIGICAGAKVVAAAGLLDGRRATTHWYYVDDLVNAHPGIQHVADRRIVVDQGVVTTTGITASLPLALLLVEAIGGRDPAENVARELGITAWDAHHASARFRFTRPFALTTIRNRLAFWNHEELGYELGPGVDEVALALVLDAWSRTFRSRAVTFAPEAGPRATRAGMHLVPDQITDRWPAEQRLPPIGDRKAGPALDDGLEAIGARYGPDTQRLVSKQLEYAKPP